MLLVFLFLAFVLGVVVSGFFFLFVLFWVFE